MIRRANLLLRFHPNGGAGLMTRYPKMNMGVFKYTFPDSNQDVDLSSLNPNSDFRIPHVHNINFNFYNMSFVSPRATGGRAAGVGVPTFAFVTFKDPKEWYDQLDVFAKADEIEKLLYTADPLALRIDVPQGQTTLRDNTTPALDRSSWQHGVDDGKNIQINLPQLLYGDTCYIVVSSVALFDNAYQNTTGNPSPMMNCQIDWTSESIKMSDYLFIKEREKNGLLRPHNTEATIIPKTPFVVIAGTNPPVLATAQFSGYLSEGKLDVIAAFADSQQPRVDIEIIEGN